MMSPSAAYSYRSLLADHAIEVLGESEAAWEEFAAVDLNVLAPERTLFEKLAAVHDAANRKDTAVLLTCGRRFYDVHCLVRNSEVVAALETIGPVDKQKLVDDIEQQSVAAGFSSTNRPTGGYASSPAFDPTHLSREAIETGYKAAQELIYGAHVPLHEVVASVQRVRELL